MNYQYLNILGTMSGTSLDGIDISVVRTNGLELERLNKNFFKFNNETQKNCLNLFKLHNLIYMTKIILKLKI